MTPTQDTIDTTINPDDFVGTTEAAKRLGMHPHSIVIRCQKNQIPGAVQLWAGGRWRIPKSWVEETAKKLARVQPIRRKVER